MTIRINDICAENYFETRYIANNILYFFLSLIYYPFYYKDIKYSIDIKLGRIINCILLHDIINTAGMICVQVVF